MIRKKFYKADRFQGLGILWSTDPAQSVNKVKWVVQLNFLWWGGWVESTEKVDPRTLPIDKEARTLSEQMDKLKDDLHKKYPMVTNRRAIKQRRLTNLYLILTIWGAIALAIYMPNISVTNLKSSYMSKELIKPKHNRVLVRPIEADSITKGGIIIPDAAKEKPIKGTVVACGPGLKDRPMCVEVGEVIMYPRLAGIKVTQNGEELLMLFDTDCLGGVEMVEEENKSE